MMKNSKQNNLTSILLRHDCTKSIVFSLSDLSDFPPLLSPFLEDAERCGTNVVRVRFVPDTDGTAAHALADAAVSSGAAAASNAASGTAVMHSDKAGTSGTAAPAPAASDGLKVIEVPLNHRFHHFTASLHEEICRQEKGTLFIFDCLSELQTAWATDLMMVNFFRVTSPLLEKLEDSALFPLMGLMHSDSAARKIMQSADAFLEVSSDFKNIYVRPEKVFDEKDPALMSPHIFLSGENEFAPITDGVKLSRFHRAQDMKHRIHADLSMDSWDRFFLNAQRKYEYGENLTQDCAQMCRIMMSRDTRMRDLILENFLPADYFFVKEHMVGSGQIGGKACGMLTARKIIENRRPELYDYMEAHDSFYIGSDVFSSYIVENGLWDLSVRQRTEEGYFSESEKLRNGLIGGHFWDEIEQQFEHLLDYYGQAPIIVRSSAILEDGFDNAFAGKYDSVFVPNTGTMAERLRAFENAVRTVYASTMSLSALDYRKRRGLDRRDEQMAILVMRVSGSHFGDYFLPCAAGVGYSYSPYRFLPDLDPEAGMLRLVMGLGTSAVDRTEGAYPRLVSLDNPQAAPYHTSAEKHRYSQRKISLIDKTISEFRYVSLEDLYGAIPPWLRRILLEHDSQAERVFRERGQMRNIEFISCRGITANAQMMDLMREMLRQLQDSYRQCVDIEFTINLSEDGDFVVNLLQCRPLLVMQEKSEKDEAENGAADISGGSCTGGRIFLETKNSSMGMSRQTAVDGIVFIDPVAYYEMPYKHKPQIARSLGKLNWHFRDAGKQLVLLTPGRIGTSSPELGVPTAFSDISSFNVICEMAESRAGYQPELSYGSHIFQDLVEADILYDAVFEDEKRVHFHPEYFAEMKNSIRDIVPDADENVIGFYDVSGRCTLDHDMRKQCLKIIFT